MIKDQYLYMINFLKNFIKNEKIKIKFKIPLKFENKIYKSNRIVSGIININRTTPITSINLDSKNLTYLLRSIILRYNFHIAHNHCIIIQISMNQLKSTVSNSSKNEHGCNLLNYLLILKNLFESLKKIIKKK